MAVKNSAKSVSAKSNTKSVQKSVWKVCIKFQKVWYFLDLSTRILCYTVFIIRVEHTIYIFLPPPGFEPESLGAFIRWLIHNINIGKNKNIKSICSEVRDELEGQV